MNEPCQSCAPFQRTDAEFVVVEAFFVNRELSVMLADLHVLAFRAFEVAAEPNRDVNQACRRETQKADNRSNRRSCNVVHNQTHPDLVGQNRVTIAGVDALFAGWV